MERRASSGPPSDYSVQDEESKFHHKEDVNGNEISLEIINQSVTSITGAAEEEEEREPNKFVLDEMRFSNAMLGICSVCQISIKGDDADPTDFEKALLCSEGHLICPHCVQQFAIQSNTYCVLCMQSQLSISNSSKGSSVKSVKSKKRSCNSKSRTRHDRANVQHFAGLTTDSQTNVASSYNIGTNVVESYSNENYTVNFDDTEDSNDEESKDKEIYALSGTKHASCNSMEQMDKPSNSTLMTINSQMMSECSRRPIRCPCDHCSVNVAFSALTNHFIFDHPDVPILCVDPGEKSTLILNFDGLAYDYGRCLALLLVSGKLSGPAAKQFNGSHIHPRYKNRLPLPILAARLHCNASYSGDFASDDNDGGDVVIAWVAGLDIGNSATLRCSIQAFDSTDIDAFRSLTYTGPINSLRTAQNPREVFLYGDCVILHDGFINHITSGCENLNVNITIH